VHSTSGGSYRRSHWLALSLLTACVRLDNAPPAKETIEAALGIECLPAAIAGARVNKPGVVTTGDLIGFDVRAAYLGRNPFELQAGTRLKRLTDSLMENTGDNRGVAVWPIDLRLAVHKGPAVPVDTVGFRCYALHDRFGELRVIQREPDRIGTLLTQFFSRLSSVFN